MIAKNNNVLDSHIIPVISTDEIGALTIAFNDIQKLTKNNQIHLKSCFFYDIIHMGSARIDNLFMIYLI